MFKIKIVKTDGTESTHAHALNRYEAEQRGKHALKTMRGAVVEVKILDHDGQQVNRLWLERRGR